MLKSIHSALYADGIYNCQESDLVTVNTDIGKYEQKHNEIILPNDPQIMNFQRIIHDGWNEPRKNIIFNSPSTFTMPEHDVVIVLDKSVEDVSH